MLKLQLQVHCFFYLVHEHIYIFVSNDLSTDCISSNLYISPLPGSTTTTCIVYNIQSVLHPLILFIETAGIWNTSSLGLKPGVSNHFDQIRSNLPGHPLCWYKYFSLMRVCPMCATQELLVGGRVDFQPIRMSFLAWNSALENATLVNSSGITSSRDPQYTTQRICRNLCLKYPIERTFHLIPVPMKLQAAP